MTGMSREFESRANFLARLEVLSLVLQLAWPFSSPYMFHICAILVTCQSRDPIARLLWIARSWDYFSFSHTLPLHNSHLNIGYLIAKLLANLAWTKANKWLNKFNLTRITKAFSKSSALFLQIGGAFFFQMTMLVALITSDYLRRRRRVFGIFHFEVLLVFPKIWEFSFLKGPILFEFQELAKVLYKECHLFFILVLIQGILSFNSFIDCLKSKGFAFPLR